MAVRNNMMHLQLLLLLLLLLVVVVVVVLGAYAVGVEALRYVQSTPHWPLGSTLELFEEEN